MAALTKSDRADYQELKHRLRTWVDDAFQRSQDLRRIRDDKLFLADNYDSFAEFCREELGYTSQWANQIIRSADAAARISETIVSGPVPANEAQARELAKAPTEVQAKVWADVVEEHGEKVTAAKVAEAVAKKTPVPKPESPPKPVKNGREKVMASQRKAWLSAFGVLSRMVDDLKIRDAEMVAFLRKLERIIKDA